MYASTADKHWNKKDDMEFFFHGTDFRKINTQK